MKNLFYLLTIILAISCLPSNNCSPTFWSRYNPAILGKSPTLLQESVDLPLLVIDSAHCYRGNTAYRYHANGLEMPFSGGNHIIFKKNEQIMIETYPLSKLQYHETVVLFDFSLQPRIDTLFIKSKYIKYRGNQDDFYLLFMDDKFYSEKYKDTLYLFGLKNILGLDMTYAVRTCYLWVGKEVGIVGGVFLLPKKNALPNDKFFYIAKRYGDSSFSFSADSVLMRSWQAYANHQGLTMPQLYQAFDLCPALAYNIWINCQTSVCDSMVFPK